MFEVTGKHLFHDIVQERARPEFEHKIKNHLSRASEKQAKRFIIFNEVLNRQEYIQPASWFLPKLFSSFSILIVMVSIDYASWYIGTFIHTN